MIQSQNWPEPKVDYEVDAEQYMELANDREKLQAKEKDERVPVDKTGRFEVSYQVYYDETEKPWDVYLTKVDLKNGIYGDYVFYKMQLLYDTNRDLYVVFTRWGRIGETGMNQRTPFTKLEDAKEDYCKIFKQKTGGNNFEELDKFSRVKKKYNLTRVNYITVNMKDYLQPFDYEKCPKSRLPQSLYDLFQEISNVTMYQRAINQYGIDTNVLPFSGVNK
jgi:predicted DNA-binding WGR domain protein